MTIIPYILHAILFLLELFALVAFSIWGFLLMKSLFFKILFGIGIPLVIAIFWGLYLSPKAAITIPFSLKLILQFTIFALAALSLHATGKSGIGIVFFLTVVVNKMLLFFIDK